MNKITRISISAILILFVIIACLGILNDRNTQAENTQKGEDKSFQFKLAACWFNFTAKTLFQDQDYMPEQECLEAMTRPIVTDDVETDLKYSVAYKAIVQYFIVRKLGDKTERCVHSGLVAGAFLQVPDVEEYKRWKDIRDQDCK